MLDRRLQLHLATWLGQWPAGPGLHVVASRRRAQPAWDGRLRPALAVDTGQSGVLSVAPERVAAIRSLVRRTPDRLLAALPEAVGLPDWCVHDGPFRWSVAPAPLPDVGEWTDPTAPGLPPWLRLFDQPVLVVRDPDGAYLAGAGIKRHDAYGHELAVGTVPAAQGAASPADSWPRRRDGSSTRGRCRPICTSGTTTPPPGWPTRPVFRIGAGGRTGSIRADRPAGR